jgi:hypothetical protein
MDTDRRSFLQLLGLAPVVAGAVVAAPAAEVAPTPPPVERPRIEMPPEPGYGMGGAGGCIVITSGRAGRG